MNLNRYLALDILLALLSFDNPSYCLVSCSSFFLFLPIDCKLIFLVDSKNNKTEHDFCFDRLSLLRVTIILTLSNQPYCLIRIRLFAVGLPYMYCAGLQGMAAALLEVFRPEGNAHVIGDLF